MTDQRHSSSRPEPRSYLRYQPYQFSHLGGDVSPRGYRNVPPHQLPRDLEDCDKLIKELAKRTHRPNCGVDVEDLVQIGETTLWEGLRNLQVRGILPNPEALAAFLDHARKAMAHAIDQRLVHQPARRDDAPEWSDPDAEDSLDEDGWLVFCRPILMAECNHTVGCLRIHWYFVPDCVESWGAPLPPGSCQPRPGALCRFPRHLPFVDR